MRVLITGVDAGGRSCVVSERAVTRSPVLSRESGAGAAHFAGTAHGWQAGPHGCRSLVLVIGTPPSD
jgi:hypothetical protein